MSTEQTAILRELTFARAAGYWATAEMIRAALVRRDGPNLTVPAICGHLRHLTRCLLVRRLAPRAATDGAVGWVITDAGRSELRTCVTVS